MLRKSLSFAAAFAALSFASACVLGHELDENRATLALRDKTHISITLYLAYTDALHLALAPQQPMDEFLVTRSAMKPEELQRELLRAQAKFQAATHVFLSVAHG